MHQYQNLLFEIKSSVGIITINRPDKMNALNLATIKEIGKAVTNALSLNEIRSIIITGSGNKAFIAGADIAEFANFTADNAQKMSEKGHHVFDTIENAPKPIIAAINGFALGGGCELAMACHFRYASPNAKFGQPEVNLGLIPGYGGTQRLVRFIGETKATEMLLLGNMIDANEALELGLLTGVVEAENLMEKCMEVAHKIAEKSPLAVQKILHLVNMHETDSVDGFAMEIAEFASCFNTEDFKEGTQAFLEKRKANFTGR